MRAYVALGIALLSAGCTNDCEEAKDKLDSCGDQIHHTAGTSMPTPITITDDCSGKNRCVSECVDTASCDALAYILNHVSDPNRPIPEGAKAFSECFTLCTGFRP
jgi:hypothetical protein